MRVILAVWAAALGVLVSGLVGPTGAAAQQGGSYWVQIEAQPNRVEAEERLRDYAARLTDVNGFALDTGWYAIALGPYDEAGAEARLAALRATGRVPRDSYVAESADYLSQIWPPGADALRAPAAGADTPEIAVAPIGEAALTAAPQPVAVPPDETPREARASEALLDQAAREELQIALRWAGHYDAAIDGVFGRGTRAAMAAWQAQNGVEVTGVLTTRQRAALLGQYNAILDGTGLALRTDTRMGIEMAIPTDLVAFEAYEAPFARYAPTGDLPVQLVQISRPGDRDNLFGLYDILQTLEIVPTEGPRARRDDGFSITGRDDRIVSRTEVVLADGAIKGWILVWPRGDEARRTRVVAEIAESFRVLPGALPLDAGLPEAPARDLLSGLEIRTPLRSRSGVFIAPDGAVLTALEAVEGCGRITLDDRFEARVAARDTALGVALLAPEVALAPPAVAALSARPPRLDAEVAVSGFSYEGRLGAPTLTYGTLADATDLAGDPARDRLRLAALPGDAGGPVFDETGAMIGLLLPRAEDGRALPEDVAFTADAAALRAWLAAAGRAPAAASGAEPLPPERLARSARAMTVLVSCWE